MELDLSLPLSERVKRARVAQRLSQKDLADRLGISQQTIGKIETGSTTTSRHLLALARELRVPAAYFDMAADLGAGASSPTAPPPAIHQDIKPKNAPSGSLDLYGLQMVGDEQTWPERGALGPIDRPSIVGNAPEAYALYVAERHASPAIDPGDIVILNPSLPPLVGTDCAFITPAMGDHARTVRFRRIRDITDDGFLVERFSPKASEEIAFSSITAHRVVAIYRRA
jgi:transcriptional regulator with XRE-family HTH domain